MDKYIEEWHNALKWALKEEDLVKERLRETGKLIPGLDANSKEYKFIYEELNRRRIDIQERAKRGE